MRDPLGLCTHSSLFCHACSRISPLKPPIVTGCNEIGPSDVDADTCKYPPSTADSEFDISLRGSWLDLAGNASVKRSKDAGSNSVPERSHSCYGRIEASSTGPKRLVLASSSMLTDPASVSRPKKSSDEVSARYSGWRISQTVSGVSIPIKIETLIWGKVEAVQKEIEALIQEFFETLKKETDVLIRTEFETVKKDIEVWTRKDIEIVKNDIEVWTREEVEVLTRKQIEMLTRKEIEDLIRNKVEVLTWGKVEAIRKEMQVLVRKKTEAFRTEMEVLVQKKIEAFRTEMKVLFQRKSEVFRREMEILTRKEIESTPREEDMNRDPLSESQAIIDAKDDDPVTEPQNENTKASVLRLPVRAWKATTMYTSQVVVCTITRKRHFETEDGDLSLTLISKRPRGRTEKVKTLKGHSGTVDSLAIKQSYKIPNRPPSDFRSSSQ